eukprot:COSAG02_NODE_22379_length_754_cov_1.629008_1_plen_123_part_00
MTFCHVFDSVSVNPPPFSFGSLDCSWMFGLDDIATQRRREKVLLAVLTRLVCIADCAPPTKSKRIAPPFIPFTFEATTNRKELHARKMYWDAHLKAEWDRNRKLRLDREDAEYAARSKITNI